MAKDKRYAELVERFSSRVEEIERAVDELQELQQSFFTLGEKSMAAASASNQDY
jgi:hypothetical protein